MVEAHPSLPNLNELSQQIKDWGQELGFQQVSIAPIDLEQAGERLNQWLAKGYHGNMHYMAKHGSKRYRPNELLPGTVRVICVRMNYLVEKNESMKYLQDPNTGYISLYAQGRDYHKVLRKRLNQLCDQITERIPTHQYRAFVDSAPVMEKALANASSLGWQGKHSLMIHPKDGSWFFLGAIYTNIPLPTDAPTRNRCGECRACITICPTQAIVAPYELDARRCISYLTIENKEAIPVEFRHAIGNRIFGCDDCQLICPWNRYAKLSQENDFNPRHQIKDQQLIALFNWSEATFLKNTEGSPIRRTGYRGWLRNIALALGNAPYHTHIIEALQQHQTEDPMVREHIEWALDQQARKKDLPI